jgi:hypothetical protein
VAVWGTVAVLAKPRYEYLGAAQPRGISALRVRSARGIYLGVATLRNTYALRVY